MFTVRIDGTGFRRLHAFAAGRDDGAEPKAALVLDGNGNIYGTTARGGAADAGTVFTLRTDGSAFTLLHAFEGGPVGGATPTAAVVLDGEGMLYGTTSRGRREDAGVVFRVRTNGDRYEVLHEFGAGQDGAGAPYALVLDKNGMLYGTTTYGGRRYWSLDWGFGVVFQLRKDGSGYRILHAFDGHDGAFPSGPLTMDSAGTLFGVTRRGGDRFADGGVVFAVGTDGSGYRVLHEMNNVAGEGVWPLGGLSWDGAGALVGMTDDRGTPGTIFSVKPDGTDFRILASMARGAVGYLPNGSLVLESGSFYGTMSRGGALQSGSIFSIRPDGTGLKATFDFEGAIEGGTPHGGLAANSRGVLYGTSGGGISGLGAVFAIHVNGDAFQLIHSFGGVEDGGQIPTSTLFLDGGWLYGLTQDGTVFRMHVNGEVYEILRAFGREPSSGIPFGLTSDAAGSLYGTTWGGADGGAGTIFTMRSDGTAFRTLHEFGPAASGERQEFPAELIFDPAGVLYGTTSNLAQDQSARGSVFRMKTDGSGFEVLHRFGGVGDGVNPLGPVVLDSAGNLYGATSGGDASVGTVYTIRADGTGYRVVHRFTIDSSGGLRPSSGLALDSIGNLYGSTRHGGPGERGTVYTLRTDGSRFQIIHAFGTAAENGLSPEGTPVVDALGRVFGVTTSGGAGRLGTVFMISSVRSEGREPLRSLD